MASNKKDLPTPKIPADLDELLNRFQELFGREPTREERNHLDYAKKLLAERQRRAED
ncbi:MAG: hypothetical protein JO266_16170 [Acidobacteria bacterium]|nr:hypothetical protein [Acidobacteriota bacterium]MBV8893481.1 hypothetical protein [Acidobacteriota bacterium]MBV9482735.1 hypothetical protein [Acidobacteriota bacterium]